MTFEKRSKSSWRRLLSAAGVWAALWLAAAAVFAQVERADLRIDGMT